MDRTYTIFYSWQSSVGSSENRSYIRNAIKRFIEKSNYKLNLDEATKYRAGSPDIASTVMEKIGQADIFVCDLSIVEKDEKGICFPNSNVLFELGLAVSQLGWERIIIIVNTHYGNPELLPFDINHHRFFCYENDGGSIKKELNLKDPLNAILSEYDEIVERFHHNEWRNHDIKLFRKLMELCPEHRLVNSINNCKSSHKFDGLDNKFWNTIVYFNNYPENFFIYKKLNESFKLLAKAIDKMQTDFYSLFKSVDDGYEIEEPDIKYSQFERERILRSQIYRLREPSYPRIESDENIRDYYRKIDDSIKTINVDCDNVIKCYNDFRISVKQILVI